MARAYPVWKNPSTYSGTRTMGLHCRLAPTAVQRSGSAHRRYLLPAILAVGLLAGLSHGIAAPDTPPPGQDSWRGWKGVLYRVVDDKVADGTAQPAVSFVFGTIHFGSPEELALDVDVVREALRNMHLLINETDSQASWTAALEQHRTLEGTRGLPGLIGPAAFKELQRLLPQVPAPWLHRLKPWAALALLEARGETAGEQTLDTRIERWATQAGMPVEHLETLAEQLSALDCVPAAEHAQVLQQRLRTPWLFAEQSARVLEYYRTRDIAAWLDEIDAMVGLDTSGRAVEERARRCLIEDRNARWLPHLEPLLRAGGAFVSVGAIHLTGADGLLEQLRRRGFLIVAEPL